MRGGKGKGASVATELYIGARGDVTQCYCCKADYGEIALPLRFYKAYLWKPVCAACAAAILERSGLGDQLVGVACVKST